MEQPVNQSSHEILFAALSKAQSKIIDAEKDKVNPHFNQPYATLASVWAACRGPLTENNLCVIQNLKQVDNRLVIETILGHSSGQQISSICPVLSDKNTMQGIGSAITYARRYSLSAIVGVAPGDDDDGNAAEGDGKKKTSADHGKKSPNQNSANFVIGSFSKTYKGKKLSEVPREELIKMADHCVKENKLPVFVKAVEDFLAMPEDPKKS